MREFASAEVNAEQVHVYSLRARWVERGITMDQSVDVRAIAGTQVTVDFHAAEQALPAGGTGLPG